MGALARIQQNLSQRLGLGGRFAAFVCGLLLFVGAAALLFVQHAKHAGQEGRAGAMASQSALNAAHLVAPLAAAGRMGEAGHALRAGLAANPDLIRLEALDGEGRVIAAAGDARAPDGPVRTATAAFAQESGAQGRVVAHYTGGAAPFLPPLMFASLMMVVVIALAIPLTLFVVRRTMAPLDKLIAHAKELAQRGQAQPIELNTGDEFETLAGAFNAMVARLEASARRARKLAYIDPVTELPNAERFRRDLRDHFLSLTPKSPIGVVLVVSLERAARATELLGQDATQELLAIAAQRLTTSLKTVDRTVRLAACETQPSIAARLSGSDFAVLAPSLSSVAEAARYVQLVVAAFSQPVEWRGQKMNFGPVAGVSVIPRDADDAENAIRHASLALSAARQERRSMRFFTRALDEDAHARQKLEREIREGLERNDFRAHFQPKIELATGRLCGAEALARWVLPDGASIGPGVFIPAAEENGLIIPIAEAILRDSCWKAAAWARAGIPVPVAVNVSPLQFSDDRFAQRVLRILDHSGLDGSLLQIEITESAAMQDVERVIHIIEPLRARGVRFAIDDFGTGHSSLAVITRLPIDILKIDQQFIRGLERDRNAPAIVDTILAMATTLNMDTIAEGIETPEQAEFLRRRGCREGQGFLFGPAMPAADFAEFAARNRMEMAVAEAPGLRGFLSA